MSVETDCLVDDLLAARVNFTYSAIIESQLDVARAALVAHVEKIERERDAWRDQARRDATEAAQWHQKYAALTSPPASGDVPEGMDFRTLIREAFIAGGREMCATGICIRAADEYAAKIAAAQNGPAHD